jgi:hypothetical protein
VLGARLSDLRAFHSLLAVLLGCAEKSCKLSGCSGRVGWPKRGVYFFMEDGEARSDSGSGPRIVRVGNHPLTDGSGSKLWTDCVSTVVKARAAARRTPSLACWRSTLNVCYERNIRTVQISSSRVTPNKALMGRTK